MGIVFLPLFRAGVVYSGRGTLEARIALSPSRLVSWYWRRDSTSVVAGRIARFTRLHRGRWNHHGNSAIDEETPHGFFLWWERADDLPVLIDRGSTTQCSTTAWTACVLAPLASPWVDTPSLWWRVQERTWTRWSATAKAGTRIPVPSYRGGSVLDGNPGAACRDGSSIPRIHGTGIAFRTPTHACDRFLRWHPLRGCPLRRVALERLGSCSHHRREQIRRLLRSQTLNASLRHFPMSDSTYSQV